MPTSIEQVIKKLKGVSTYIQEAVILNAFEQEVRQDQLNIDVEHTRVAVERLNRRDAYRRAALTGLLANPEAFTGSNSWSNHPEQVATEAKKFGDAMLDIDLKGGGK